MSAYMCDAEHIVYLVSAAMSNQLEDMGTFSWYARGVRFELSCGADKFEMAKVCNMLWEENERSINARYPADKKTDYPGNMRDAESGYVMSPDDCRRYQWAKFDPVQVLKACSCYDYQSCETGDYSETPAAAFVDSLRKRAIRSLPGYEAAKWGAPAPRSVAAPAVRSARVSERPSLVLL